MQKFPACCLKDTFGSPLVHPKNAGAVCLRGSWFRDPSNSISAGRAAYKLLRPPTNRPPKRPACSIIGPACSKREGYVINHKKLFRLCREKKLAVRRCGGRKRAIGTRAQMMVPSVPNQRWSLGCQGAPDWVLAELLPVLVLAPVSVVPVLLVLAPVTTPPALPLPLPPPPTPPPVGTLPPPPDPVPPVGPPPLEPPGPPVG
jgi:hypothetical protein